MHLNVLTIEATDTYRKYRNNSVFYNLSCSSLGYAFGSLCELTMLPVIRRANLLAKSLNSAIGPALHAGAAPTPLKGK